MLSNNTNKIGGGHIALLIFTFTPINILFGWVLTPVVLCAIYFLISIYLIMRDEISMKISILLIVLSVEIVVTNIAGATFFGISLFSIIAGTYIAEKFNLIKRRKYAYIFIFFWIFNIAYWIYINNTFDYFIYDAFKAPKSEFSILVVRDDLLNPMGIDIYTQIINASWFYAIEIISILCVLISTNANKFSEKTIVCSIGILSISFIMAISVLANIGIGSAVAYRWLIPLAIFMCISIPDLWELIVVKFINYSHYKKLITFIILSSIVYVFIFSPVNSFDSPNAEATIPSTAFKDSEISGANFASRHLDNKSTIYSDYFNTHLFGIDYDNFKSFSIDNSESYLPNSLLLIRKEIYQYPYYVQDSFGQILKTNTLFNESKIYGQNLIYNSDEIKLFGVDNQ